MKKPSLTAITVLAVLSPLIIISFPFPVRADNSDPAHFIDAGLTIYSPTNTTHYYKPLLLNISLGSAGNLGGLDPNISMNFTIDETYFGTVTLKSSGEIHVLTRAVGEVLLPDLPDGPHTLTIYLYGLNQRTYEPKYLSFVLCVYFSTEGNPNQVPTATPTASTISPTPTLPILATPAATFFLNTTANPSPSYSQDTNSPLEQSTTTTSPASSTENLHTINPANDPLPYLIGVSVIVAVSAAGIALGMLFYFRKRNVWL